eukprot:Pompholyxophrys_punicea_v1_NODE_3_length_10569_cov_612.508655.p4 type:complete len:162 gc:universal NODE_3_length_10569_cov_612.508655:9782-10267(+)
MKYTTNRKMTALSSRNPSHERIHVGSGKADVASKHERINAYATHATDKSGIVSDAIHFDKATISYPTGNDGATRNETIKRRERKQSDPAGSTGNDPATATATQSKTILRLRRRRIRRRRRETILRNERNDLLTATQKETIQTLRRQRKAKRKRSGDGDPNA